jgi:hypothetical protein
MAAKLTNSEKNARARAKYIEALAKANQANIEGVQKQIDSQRSSWQQDDGVGNDVMLGDRLNPRAIFRPKKSGGGKLLRQGEAPEDVSKTELELARDSGQRLLAASGSTGEAKTGATGQSFGDALGEATKGVSEAADGGDGIDVMNAYLAGGGKLLGNVAPWVTENMGEAEAPQNAGQWLINLLSTGTYVGANAVEGVADAIEANNERHRKGEAGPFSGLQALGESVVNPIRYGARGVAEGLGFRFDDDGDGRDERPQTHGQNLEDFGTERALKGALGDKAGGFTQGLLGTAADIAGDPLTFATLGLTGVGRGAIEGATEAAARGAGAAEKAALGTAGAVKGGWEGAAARRSEITNERFRAWQARQVRRDQKNLTPEEFAAKWGGIDIPEASPQLALPAGRPVVENAQDVAAGGTPERTFVASPGGDVFEPQNMDLRNPQLALPATASDYRPKVGSVEEAQAAWRQAGGAGPDAEAASLLRATDELTPKLTYQVTPKVEPSRILDQALAAGTTQVKVPALSQEASVNVALTVSNVHKHIKQGANPERTIRGALSQLEANPEIASRLGLVGADDGSTIADLIEAAMRGHRPSIRAVSTLWRREVDETATALNTPALREAIDQIVPGAREALGITGSKLHKLTYRLSRTADPTKQQEILQGVLGKTYQAGYPDFRAALQGAARGELQPEQMADMLSALGVRTRATKPATLKELLSTKGLAAYDAAVARIPTPEQINRAFNVTPEVAEQAAKVDVDTELADAAQAADEMVAATPGAEQIPELDVPATIIEAPGVKPPKPPVIPAKTPSEITADQLDSKGGQLDPVGRGAYAGVRKLGQMLRTAIEDSKAGNTLSSYTDEVAVAVSRAIVEQIKMKYLKKGGAERAERFLPRYLESLRLVESWAWGKGIVPHLVDQANGTGAIYVSHGQVFELLPEDTLGAAMFAPRKNRKSADAEAAIGYVNGMTVYPNHIMAGVKLALAGGNADAVATLIGARAVGASKGMQRGTDSYVKAFAETAEGKAAIQNLAEDITEPGVLDAIRAIDARQRPVAEAIKQRYIDNVTARAGERIMEAVRDGGDRGTLLRVLREVDEWATDAVRPAMLDSDRISASVQERLDSAIVKGVLGEEGFLTAQHDWAFATAVERVTPSQRAERQAAALRREQERLKGRKPAPAAEPVPAPVHRNAVAEASGPEVLQAEATARAVAQLEVEQTVGRALREEADEALWAEVDTRAAANIFTELGKRFSGRFGQGKVWGIRTSAEEGSYAQAAAYTGNLRTWVHGTASRMSQELGRAVTPQEALDHLNGPIFRALAATDPENWGARGKLYTELINGRSTPRIPREGERGALTEDATFSALSEFDAKLALELHRFIDHVFNPEEGGMFGRSGLTSADVASSSEWYLRGDLQQYRLDAGEALVDQAQKWRAWGGAESPLDIIDRTHQALQAAIVPQQIGHMMTNMFSGRALRPGVSSKQLYAEGWRRVDTSAARNVGRFVRTDDYFPPEILSQIRYVDEFLAASRGFNPDNPIVQWTVRPYDAVTRVLKSSNTIWRPGHHVTNVLGEFGMLLMAGVNPLQAVRGLKTIRAGGGLMDADMGILDEVAREAVGKKVPDPKFADEVVRLVVRDGRGGKKIEEVPLRTVWEWAVNSGVALTHTAARDLVTETAEGLAKRFNPVRETDEALGRFSAHRDNVTRIAHFIDALEKGTWANLDEARGKAATVVHDYHPTVRTLSRFEQKYMRRIVFFYTWVRQAISRVLRTAADQPGLVTMPFKAQYNMAEAAGLNPESIGGPTSDDPRLASYTRNSLLGPTMVGLFADPEAEDAQLQDLWSGSLSAPQIDTLQTLFGTMNVRPGQDPIGNALVSGAELGNDVLNPLLGFGPEVLAESQKFGDSGKDWLQILSESAGAPTALARAIPAGTDPETGATRSAYSELFPNSSGAKRSPEEQQQELARYAINYLTGLRLQNVTNDASEKRAKAELTEKLKREGTGLGLESDQISEVRDLIWQWKLANQTRG